MPGVEIPLRDIGEAAHTGTVTNPKSPSHGSRTLPMTESQVTGQVCSNCGTTKTPLWRRGADGKSTCNACGLYFRANNSHRPVHLKKPPHVISISKAQLAAGTCKGDGRCNGTGGSSACTGCPAFDNRVLITNGDQKSIIKRENDDTLPRASCGENAEAGADSMAVACSNCSTTITPLWRRDDAGNTICNACGLYYRLHKMHRPVKLKRETIKRRKRNPSGQQLFDQQQKKLKQQSATNLPGVSLPQMQLPAHTDTQESHTDTQESHTDTQKQHTDLPQLQQRTPVTSPDAKALLNTLRVLPPPIPGSTQLPPFSMIGRFQPKPYNVSAIDFTSLYSRTNQTAEESSMRGSPVQPQPQPLTDETRRVRTVTPPALVNLINPGSEDTNPGI
ncbi:unnamed protein product [Kuraishia capsulata CBS 1993]|uniref:GATA-type domain-containing protein n=1 Tax=Kuraishia capsulata CBS 1993 TaxID=1382522 RepID=W6MJL0_9ASCO|nr:uncharacterized protein KUCA_T00000608001 [Kuraishia capsulata CBS 1993]CDK24642.1 unnamed protein product [Kuraishia capsulata CBS 1993]